MPEVGGTHYNLGNGLWGEGRFDEAIETYRTAARLMSNSLKVSEVLNNLGGVFYDKGLLEEAIKRMLWPSRVGLWRPSSITTLRDQHALSQGPCQPGRY